jgi:DUF971 family protein
MSAPSANEVRPLKLGKEGAEQLVIAWSDGHRSIYSWTHLREHCPCASCREDHDKPADPFRILTAADLAPKAPLAPVSMPAVGRYGYKIVWNDGHDTGIYTLENLRALCQCPECAVGPKS